MCVCVCMREREREKPGPPLTDSTGGDVKVARSYPHGGTLLQERICQIEASFSLCCQLALAHP